MEQNLRRALSITNGEIGILFESDISRGLWVLAIGMLIVPPVIRALRRRRKARASGSAA
jgi:putative tricarboxylic transport membrane protein